MRVCLYSLSPEEWFVSMMMGIRVHTVCIHGYIPMQPFAICETGSGWLVIVHKFLKSLLAWRTINVFFDIFHNKAMAEDSQAQDQVYTDDENDCLTFEILAEESRIQRERKRKMREERQKLQVTEHTVNVQSVECDYKALSKSELILNKSTDASEFENSAEDGYDNNCCSDNDDLSLHRSDSQLPPINPEPLNAEPAIDRKCVSDRTRSSAGASESEEVTTMKKSPGTSSRQKRRKCNSIVEEVRLGAIARGEVINLCDSEDE